MDKDRKGRIGKWMQSVKGFIRVEEVDYTLTKYRFKNSKLGNKSTGRYDRRE